MDVCNETGADIGSDHHTIMGVLRIEVEKVKGKVLNRRLYNLKKPDDTDCQRTIKAKIREGESSLRCVVSKGAEEKWVEIKAIFQDICESTLGFENNNKEKEWTSDSTW